MAETRTGALAAAMILPACMGAAAAQAQPAALAVKATASAQVVPAYDLFELTFEHDGKIDNPFFDVTIEVAFTSPAGKTVKIGGFHFGSDQPPRVVQTPVQVAGGQRTRADYIYDKPNLWKTRFAPVEVGPWTYSYVFRDKSGAQAAGSGTFTCDKSTAHGFVRQDPKNPFQWIHDDGTPYFPFGLQEGFAARAGQGTMLSPRAFDGPFRVRDQGWEQRDRTARGPTAEPRPPLPPGPRFAQGQFKQVSAEEFLQAYQDAGFTLWRFSNDTGGNDRLMVDLDHYLAHESRMLDELFQALHKHRMRIFFTAFGDMNKVMFKTAPNKPEDIAKVKRYLDYCVNRWGAMVDFWELMNEQYPDNRWPPLMAEYLKSIDPYHHPVSMSYEKPEIDGIDINSPHWYSEDEVESESDSMTVERCMEWRRFGKPIVLGEQGNNKGRQRFRDYPRPGDGGNWDPASGLRMRLRAWTAFCHEVSFIYWNTIYAKDGYHSNIYLGPEERQYQRVLSHVANSLGGGIVATRNLSDRRVSVRDYQQVRGYQIASQERLLVYLHHFADHTKPVQDVQIKVTVPKAGKGYWISPETGQVLASMDVTEGRQTLTVPSFTVDLALLTSATPLPPLPAEAK